MVDALNSNENYKCFWKFVQWLNTVMLGEEIPHTISKYFKHFIRAISQNVPLYHYVPYQVINVISDTFELGEWYDSDTKTLINKSSPILGCIFKFYNDSTQHILPNEFWQLLNALQNESQQKIAALCSKRQRGSNSTLYDGTLHPIATDEDRELFSQYEQSGVISGLNLIRLRPLYDIDHDSQSRQQLGDCNKSYVTHKKHTGGVFIARCLRHGIPIHAHIIKGTEALNDAFSTFLCLWQTAPSLVVSDISCHLAHYAMAREPIFFLKTLFMNDDWHGSDHKCGWIFRMWYMKLLCEQYTGVNDQIIEQGNIIVGLMKKAGLYMKKETFMQFMMLILEIDMRQKIRKIEHLPIF